MNWHIVDATQNPVPGTLAPNKSAAIDLYGRARWGRDRKELELSVVRTDRPLVHFSIEALIGS